MAYSYEERGVDISLLYDLHLMSDTEVSMGETAMSPLTEQTQL